MELLSIDNLADADDAGGRNSEKCTLILTQGYCGKALAIAGLNGVGRDLYGVFPLTGNLLSVREANSKQILENKDIQNIMKILGLELNKEYTNVKSLRYGHLMLMADRDYDGFLFKGLIIYFIHYFWPSLLKVPSFMFEFITPIVKAFHSNGTKLSFYSMSKFEQWRESLGNNANEWRIKNYKGLGTSSPEEAREYFRDLDKHRREFVWEDDERYGSAIELAFSMEKAEDRKIWELYSKEAEEERKWSSLRTGGRALATKEAPKKPPRKTNKVVEPEISNSSMEVVVETEEQPHVPAAGKKECDKRAATAKKKSSTVGLDSSDSDNENVVADDDNDDY